jgi:prepilin-type N-terminal cleavage/methylation domain-containing protein
MSQPKKSRSLRRGFTLVEVMASLGVLTIGVVGVVSLQKVTVVGNMNARNVATASAIANTWAERLHTDATSWYDDTTLAGTAWLKNADSPTLSTLELLGRGSEKADITGADIYTGDANTTAFCTRLTLIRMYPDLISATIQVYWDRNGNPIADCTQPPPASFGAISMVTGIRANVWNPTN